MIDPRYYGKNVKDIPGDAFCYGFDPDERSPALVLASVETVPAGSNGAWRLATENCGGFSCESRDAAVLPLPVRPEMVDFMGKVADEEFSTEPLDYLGMMAPDKVIAVKKGYLSSLHSVGLSCNQDNLELLTQALYPVDATPENVLILSGDSIDLSKVEVPKGLVIFIVGENCD
ncbi:hypothetical protein D3C80_178990 [compost metagenome]